MKRYIALLLVNLAVIAVGLLTPGVAGATEKFTVVIDPGHGGKDTGAVDNGLKEKDINLGVGLKLGELIRKKLKDVKVVYTRDNDSYLTLQERADKANKAKGNLFISIHTNSVDKSNKNRTTVAGSSVYALGLHKDQNNMEVARRENAVIELEKDYRQKYSGFDPNSDESYILFEMAQKKNLAKSIRFANDAQKQLVSRASRGDRGVHQAGFWVLWATSMPAVLVELDFICNPNSAKYMGSEQGQDQLAEALFQAVKTYVSNNSRAGSDVNKPETAPDNFGRMSDDLIAVAETPAHSAPRRVTASSEGTTKKNGARRRRGDNGRASSAARDVSVDSIEVRHVEKRAAIDHEVAPVSIEAKTEKSKSELRAEKKAQENARKKAEAEAKKLEKKDRENKKHKGKISRLKTVYKIQVYVSPDLLKQSDSRFNGLKPISYFKENNLYKYTYGESTSEEEIRRMLKEVRKKIPDAFIIKSMS